MRRALSIALLIAALAVTAWFVYTARHELVAALNNVSLLLVGLLYVATLSQNVVLWRLFHASASAGDDYVLTSRMHFGGQLAKYVPGKVWAVVYQASLRSDAIKVGNIVQGNIIVYAQGVMSVVVASAALLAYPVSLPLALAIVVAGVALAVWLMSSDHLYRVLQRISAVSARTEMTSDVATTTFSVPVRVTIFAALVASYVLSNVFLLSAFYDFELAEVLRLTAYLGIAWLAGIVVAVTPAGLGVREAAFVAIGYFSGENSVEVFAGIAVVARVLQILFDALSAFLVPAVVGLFQQEHKARAERAE